MSTWDGNGVGMPSRGCKDPFGLPTSLHHLETGGVYGLADDSNLMADESADIGLIPLSSAKFTLVMDSKKTYRLDLQIRPGDIDALGHVNNVVFVRWVQEAAQAHWDHLTGGDPPEDSAWVVLRHEIDYRLAVGPEDVVYAQTWVGETSGVRSVRHVVIRKGDERAVAEARTTWCLVDAATGTPKRIPPQMAALLSR
jgi:acyl-CoA thioester hydrolase